MKPTSCPGPQSRRDFLKFGALALGGLGSAGIVPWKLQPTIRAAHEVSGPDTAVIFIWLPGGPPHMEMYDMKPDAPAEYRGDFRPIRTNVPGIDVCEHLPLHAQHRRQVHAHPLDRPQLRRSRRRTQTLPHRPRSAPADRLRQRPSDGRLDGRQGARPTRRRRAQLHRRHGRRPRADRRLQLRLRLSRRLGPSLHLRRRSDRPEFQGPNLRSIQTGGAAARPPESARTPRSRPPTAAITPARWRRWGRIATAPSTC